MHRLWKAVNDKKHTIFKVTNTIRLTEDKRPYITLVFKNTLQNMIYDAIKNIFAARAQILR